MLLLGLTGSIATGKSTVSATLAGPPHNLPVVDADLFARQVVAPGTPGYHAIVRHFGPKVPDLFLHTESTNSSRFSADRSNALAGAASRPLNRPALGRFVFGDSDAAKRERAVLNGIVHPAVRRAMYRALLWAYLSGAWCVVLDVPLLFESGWEPLCGAVAVVAVRDPVMQMRRLRARDAHLSETEAEGRVRSQGDVRVKARRAEGRGRGMGWVLWNDGGKEELREQVERMVVELREGSPRWWTWLLLACPPLAVVVGAFDYVKGLRMQRAWERGEGKGAGKAKL